MSIGQVLTSYIYKLMNVCDILIPNIILSGVFTCISPTSKVKKSHLTSLDNVFRIYAKFVTEPQDIKLPGRVEYGKVYTIYEYDQIKSLSIA